MCLYQLIICVTYYSMHRGYQIHSNLFLRLDMVRPCQIGILLSVRVRVGFRVLSPIKTSLLVKF